MHTSCGSHVLRDLPLDIGGESRNLKKVFQRIFVVVGRYYLQRRSNSRCIEGQMLRYKLLPIIVRIVTCHRACHPSSFYQCAIPSLVAELPTGHGIEGSSGKHKCCQLFYFLWGILRPNPVWQHKLGLRVQAYDLRCCTVAPLVGNIGIMPK